MKILQVNKLYHPWMGGVEKIVQQVAEGLSKSHFDVDVLCVQPKGKREVEKVNGVKVYRAKSFGIFLGNAYFFRFFQAI